MNGKIFGPIALVLAVASSCAAAANLAEDAVSADCHSTLQNLPNSPLLARFGRARLVRKEPTAGRSGAHDFAVASITYDLATMDRQSLKALDLESAVDARKGHAKRLTPARRRPRSGTTERWADIFVVQQAPSPPSCFVATHGDGVDVDANKGHITIGPTGGDKVEVKVRFAIVDSIDSTSDSATYAWSTDHPEKSLGAAQEDMGKNSPCKPGTSCPGAEPPRWPANFGGYKRIVRDTGVHKFLVVRIPYSYPDTYEYWLRAFDRGLTAYDVDPKIINQP